MALIGSEHSTPGNIATESQEDAPGNHKTPHKIEAVTGINRRFIQGILDREKVEITWPQITLETIIWTRAA